MKKGRIRGWISWLLCSATAFSCCFVACSKSNGKNLIYVIGDGMGVEHIENTKLYMELDTLCFEEYYVGEVTTRSADSEVTDSAAAATALATGVKTNNGYVGMDGEGKTLENLMEISNAKGKKTGVVTTDTLDGATPAGFSAHAESRSNSYRIMEGQQAGKVDLLMGKYNAMYINGREEFEEKGFAYAQTKSELLALSKSDKVLANIKSVESVYGQEDPSSVVSLKELVEYALDFLSKENKKGFTLMVEGAYIDKHSHSNDIVNMIYALMDFNDAVAYILDWASKRTDTTVIVTADHETGGLKRAENKAAISDGLYTSTSHTASNVPLYLYNAQTEKRLLDNTEVFQLAKSVVVS